jgi:putative membrane protein
MMIFTWIFIGLAVYYFINKDKKNKMVFTNGGSPEDKLKERYVNGEIDQATYEKMKMTIRR